MTQHSCPSVQQSAPQHVVVLAQLPPWLSQGGTAQVPPTHDFLPEQWLLQLPQL
jgi:hypothetical protein